MTRTLAVFGKTGAKFMPMLAEQLPEWEVAGWVGADGDEARDALIGRCEAAIISADFVLAAGNFGALLGGAKLELVIQPWAGTDWIDATQLPAHIKICNATGHAAPMAEFVLGAMLEHVLELRRIDADMRAGSWYRSGRNMADDAPHGDLAGLRVGLIGYGQISEAVAVRAAAFDMEVEAIARRARDAAPAPLARIGTREDLPRMLGDSDFVVVACDLNDDTRGMLDAAAFAAMKPTACLVNVARGEVIDEAALYDALSTRRIAAAAIDTWYRYPENIRDPEADPDRGGAFQGSRFDFAALDNVLLTPHYAAHTHGADAARYRCIARTLRAYTEGAPLERLVLTGTGG